MPGEYFLGPRHGACAAPAETENQSIMPIPLSTCELRDGHVALQTGRSIFKTDTDKKKPVANILYRHSELVVGSPLTSVRNEGRLASESVIRGLLVAPWAQLS